MTFIEPSQDVNALIARIGRKVGVYAENDSLASEMIKDALQEAVDLVCNYRPWMWLMGTGSFDTVAGTRTYNLRTVNNATMSDLLTVISVRHDDNKEGIDFVPRDYYERQLAHDDSGGDPRKYYQEGAFTIGLWPTPSVAETINIVYMKQHRDIRMGGTLLVPSYLHMALVYLAKKIYNNELSTDTALSDATFLAYMTQAEAIDSPLGHDLASPLPAPKRRAAMMTMVVNTTGADHA